MQKLIADINTGIIIDVSGKRPRAINQDINPSIINQINKWLEEEKKEAAAKFAAE